MASDSYLAACFCGRVELTVSGSPLFAGYCHCESCRTWLGAPIHAATLWHPRDVEIRRGEQLLATYKKTERSHRKHCTACGGHVMNAHPSEETIDILAPIIRGFPFTPTMHVHYGEHTMELRDGLPKYRDLPKEFGGSGELIPEA